MNYLCVILIVFIVVNSSADVYQLSDDEYSRLPPVVSMAPWSTCLRPPSGKYCTAFLTYVADGDSTMLTMMQKLSEHTSSRFNHTRALFGTCLTHNCKDYENYTNSDQRTYLEICLNHTVWEQYRLKVKVEENVNCHEYGEKGPDAGPADMAVAGLLLALVVLNIVGSLFDVFCPTRWKSGFAGQLVLCFSIYRNWRILTAPPGGSDPRLEELKGIHGIRAISMILVVATHAVLPTVLGSDNPKFIEDLYDTVYIHVILNGTVIMQTFFFLSAFLLVYCCLLHEETSPVSWKMLPMAVIMRWLRLTPPYAIVLAVTTTWLPRVGTGPFWDYMVTQESGSCSRNWWQHLLYINNYVDGSLCMPQTWYLAADTQLYCLGLIIHVFCRSTRSRKLVISTTFVIGMLLPALHTYYQDLDGPLLASPSAAVDMFAMDRTFNETYKRGHTNINTYILGIAAAYLLYTLQNNKFNPDTYKSWRPLYWLLFPVAVAIPLACKLFYTTPRVDLLYRTLAAAFLRPVFGLVMGAIIVGMLIRLENVYRNILVWSGWVTLSRVSYSAYLLHIPYIRITYGAIHHPIRMSYLHVGEIVVFTTVMVYIAAYLFWLTVEAPLAQLMKTCFKTTPRGDKNSDVHKKNTQDKHKDTFK